MRIIKKIILFKLRIIAKLILLRHKPRIIGITGSVGKTTTKEAVKSILESDFKAHATAKSMNTEVGLPVTIFRAEMPRNPKNIFSWYIVLVKGILQIFSRDYPEILVLEMGVDKPGDMDYLLSIAKPDISVITGITGAHMESFSQVEAVLNEKKKIVTKVPKSKAILNSDFGELKSLSKEISNESFLYSMVDKNGHVVARIVENDLSGLELKILYKEKNYALKTKFFGHHSAYSLIAAFSVGIVLGMDPEIIVKKLSKLKPVPGRMHLVKGIKGSIIVDDSYNSSPIAASKALEAIEDFKKKNRIILVLGSMNELGDYTEEAHRNLGRKASQIGDVLITIGGFARDFLASEAIIRGMDRTKVFCFKNPFEAGEKLEQIIQKGDLVLVKGSQNGIFTEEAIKYILDKSQDPEKILVRQNENWMRQKLKLRE